MGPDTPVCLFDCLFLYYNWENQASYKELLGPVQIGRLTMSRQFQLFQQTKVQIAELIGQPAADKLISDAIYSFTVGGNDFINNYLAITSQRKNQYTPPQYIQLLVTNFQGQLKVWFKIIATSHNCYYVSHFSTIFQVPAVIMLEES